MSEGDTHFDEYARLTECTKTAFESLPANEADSALQNSLRAVAEETPIRVFREFIDDAEYEVLFKKLLTKVLTK